MTEIGASPDLVGTRIAGRFSVLKMLGEGGSAQVYLAEHEVLDRLFAIKVLRDDVRGSRRFVERFRQEARAAAMLEHPNIVRVTDFGRTEQGLLYLVMEYVDGESLEQLMSRIRPEPLALERAIPILAQVSSAVAAAHGAGIIHRDLKPDNVVLGRTLSGDEQVKVLDFGLAKIFETVSGKGSMRITGEGEVFGTPEYMAPEQARGEPVDRRADVYSLGAIAYDLLTGHPPIEHESLHDQLRAIQQELPAPISTLRPASAPLVPVDLEVLVHRCLLKDPGERPSSVHGLVKAFTVHRARLPRQRSPSSPELRAAVVALLRDTDPTSSGARPEVEDTSTLEAAADTFTTQTTWDSGAEALLDGERHMWARAMKRAEHLLACLASVQTLGQPLLEVLRQQHRATEELLELETDLALERAILDEPDTSERERETMLRRAIIDLGMERDQLLAGAGAGAGAGVGAGASHGPRESALEDLDYQIRVLETNLGELYREVAQRQAGLQTTVKELETYAGLREKLLRELEASLIKEIFAARPSPCPEELANAYLGLAAALRDFSAAQDRGANAQPHPRDDTTSDG